MGDKITESSEWAHAMGLTLVLIIKTSTVMTMHVQVVTAVFI